MVTVPPGTAIGATSGRDDRFIGRLPIRNKIVSAKQTNIVTEPSRRCTAEVESRLIKGNLHWVKVIICYVDKWEIVSVWFKDVVHRFNTTSESIIVLVLIIMFSPQKVIFKNYIRKGSQTKRCPGLLPAPIHKTTPKGIPKNGGATS